MNYRGLEKIFTHNELYFASPNDLNDPFDCKTTFSFTNCNENDFQIFVENIKEYIRKSNIEVDLDKKIEGIDNNYYRQSIIDSYEDSLMEFNDKLGMLCLSEKPDDIIMWSHYADGHKGLALQFDKGGLESNDHYCGKVDYHEEYPTLRHLNESRLSQTGMAKLFLLRKSEKWSYEAEWRMIINIANEVRNVKFPKEILTGVIFGCEMQKENKEQILKLIDFNEMQVKICEAIKDDESYSLKIPSWFV